jgi:hypothetical protein
VALQIFENQVRKIKIGKGKGSVFPDSFEIGNIREYQGHQCTEGRHETPAHKRQR